ncbi:hypothetical protein [Ekhidna sp.]
MRIFLIGVVVVLIGCDSFEDRITEINSSPFFTVEGDTIMSLSDSLKITRGNYSFSVELNDAEGNLKSLAVTGGSSQGELRVNGSAVNGSIEIKELSSMTYSSSASGKQEFAIEASDEFGESTSLEVELTAFSNLLPVAVVQIVDPVIGSEFERLIDASGSFDQDARFGGDITKYEYTFLGTTVEISESSQTAIFPSAGTYQILVRVQDNDGEWSDLISIPVVL